MAITSPMAGGLMPFLVAGDPNDQSAQANAARAASGNPMPPAPGQAAAMPVMPSYSVTTKSDPTNQTTKIVEDARTKSAEAAMGEAKSARLGAVDMQAEADKEAEMNTGLKAQEEANALAAENTRLKANQVERDRRLQEATAREAAQQLQVEKNAKPTGYWQDMSTPRRILAGIFMGADAAVGGTNVAKIYGDFTAEDRQRKMAALNAEVNKLAAMGKDRVRIQEYYQQRAEEISRQEIANGKIMVKQIEASGKKFPQWAAKAEAAKAAILDDTAGKEQSHAIQMAAKLTHEDGKRVVSETTGKAEPGGNAKPTESENNLTGRAGIIKDALDVLEPNVDIVPGVYSAMSSNVTQMEGNSETAKSGILGPWAVSKAREKGYLPASPMSGIGEKFGPKGEEVAAAGERANEAVMRHLSGGAITGNLTKGEEARARNGFSHVAGESIQHAKSVNANLRKLANTLDVLGGKATDALIARSMSDIASGKEPSVLGQSTVGATNQSVNKPAQPQAAAPAAAPSAKSMVSGIARALKVKPGDPNYEAAQEFLKTHAPGRKGKN